MNLSAYLSTYGEALSARVSPARAAVEASVLRHHLLPAFGEVEMRAIGSAAIKDYMAAKLRAGVAASTVNSHVAILRKILHDADERGVTPYPVKGRIQKARETRVTNELSDDEIEALKSALRGREFLDSRVRGRDAADYLLLALETGISRTDLLALRWSQVDGRVVRLERHKTGRQAVIPLSELASSILESRTRRSDAVFDGLSVATVERHFAAAKGLAGISRRVRLHDLRHTFASRLASRGVPLQMIAACLGHSTTKMSERYARPSEESLGTVADALNNKREVSGMN